MHLSFLGAQDLPMPSKAPEAPAAVEPKAAVPPEETRKALAAACAALAASLIQKDPALSKPEERLMVAKALGLARDQDPDHASGVVMHMQFSRGIIPSKPELARPLPEVAGLLKEALKGLPKSEEPAARLLRGRVLDLLAAVDPSDETVLLELAKLEKDGPVDWAALLPAGAVAAPAAPAMPAPPASPAPVPAPAASASTQPGFGKDRSVIKALFVVQTGAAGMTGVSGNLILTHDKAASLPAVEATITSAGSVGEHMRAALGEATRYINSHRAAGKGARFTFGFDEKYSPKDGGSAGAAFALLMDSFYGGFDVAPDCAITGDFSADGKILKVGGIGPKIDGARASKAQVVIIPAANRTEFEDMLVLQSAEILTQIQVFEADDLAAASEVARLDRGAELKRAIELFRGAMAELAGRGLNGLRDPAIRAKLEEVEKLAPRHLSAAYLLRWSDGKLPRMLSLNGSLDAIFEGGNLAVPVLLMPKIEELPQLRDADLDASIKRLNQVFPMLDPRTRGLQRLFTNFLFDWKRLRDYNGNDQTAWRRMVDEWLSGRRKISEETSKLTQDPEYIRKVVQGEAS